MNYYLSLHTWIAVAATLVVVMLCVGVHFEILSSCNRYLRAWSHVRRRRVLILILVILVAHTIEIWLFASGYYLLLHTMQIGDLAGLARTATFPDYVYFSAMVYTTVGFGDIVPIGAIRFLTGVEALTGLVMITWSASYTFLEMQRDWPGGR
jgi:hypothetical protein